MVRHEDPQHYRASIRVIGELVLVLPALFERGIWLVSLTFVVNTAPEDMMFD